MCADRVDAEPAGAAEQGLRRALESEPDNAEVLAALTDCLRERGRLEEAWPLYDAAIARNREDARLHRDQGILLLDLDRLADALAPLSRSVELDPRDARAQNNLGFALERCGKFRQAVEAFRACIAIDPDHLFAHVNLIFTLERCNEIIEARRHLDQARVRFPDDESLTLPEAIVLKRERRFEEAIGLLEAGRIDRDPGSVIRARYELGRLYDRVGETDKAFRQFARMNALAREAASPLSERKPDYPAMLEGYRAVFTEAWIRSWTSLGPVEQGETPAFLFSFARSGTTLLQQMLSSHAAAHVAGEAPAAWHLAVRLRQLFGDRPEGLAGLSESEAGDLRRLYFASLRAEPDWTEAGLLIDKNPFIAALAGPLARLFPAAKMIFALRHPCDVVLSCFMHLLKDRNLITIHLHDLQDIVTLYGRTMDLWRHYESVLPLTVHYTRYEDLVEDPEATMRGLLAFLELPWDDAVLRYYERDVGDTDKRLPNYDMVSERPYRRARFRWHRYRAYLEPYLAQLEPYCRRFGYEI